MIGVHEHFVDIFLNAAYVSVCMMVLVRESFPVNKSGSSRLKKPPCGLQLCLGRLEDGKLNVQIGTSQLKEMF